MKTKFLPLLLLPFLAACSGGKEPAATTNAADLQLIAAKCSELSGYTGQAAHVKEAGITFVFRSDG
ncbi:MAG: hypothetical protein EB165_07690, partial [Euryarchaeota archaeon]|nr:hypothetical protein [Euryarchaeota archaeon]